MHNITLYILLFAAAFGLSVLLNRGFLALWRRFSITKLKSTVKSDRWGTVSVPMTGGISIALVLMGFLFLPFPGKPAIPGNAFLISLGCAFAMFLLGLIDDIFELKSYQKFIGQILIVLVSLAFGVTARLTGTGLDLLITFFWLVGITNAFNLIDNMDGLSGGVAVIATGFLGYYFFIDGNTALFMVCCVLAAALIGFLVFNFKPAKIYLGDNGSLFIGFLLAFMTIVGSNSQVSGKSVVGVIFFPVILMLIPIFDTAFVSITRKQRGQSPFKGGRDHLSHRLVMLGMTERQAVIFLYIVSFLLGFLFIILKEVQLLPAVIIYFLVTVFVLFFGLYLGKVKLQSKESLQAEKHKKEELLTIGSNILYKSQIAKVFIDVVIITVSYYFAFLIRYGGELGSLEEEIFKQSVPFVVIAKLVALGLFRVYRTGSKYFTFSDVLNVIKSITVVNFVALTVFTIWIDKFGGFSRTIFIIDWMLSILAIGGMKVFYRFFDELFYPLRVRNSSRVLYHGTYENYVILDRILKQKNITSYRLERFINAEERPAVDGSELGGVDVLVTENYNTIRDDIQSITVCPLETFIMQLFKSGAGT